MLSGKVQRTRVARLTFLLDRLLTLLSYSQEAKPDIGSVTSASGIHYTLWSLPKRYGQKFRL